MRTTGWLAAALLAPAALLSGCGTASPTSPPTGIDELVVPTPSPDPDDFVTGLSNPWFPVADEDGTEEVDGVEVTVVDGDYFAQDRRGNVWWFGTAGEWQAGVDGAEAGLAMPAEPRYGDSWRAAYVPGEVEDVVAVAEMDEDTVVLEVTSPLEPGQVERRTVDKRD
ncbi:hypothetical protein [Nocardioides marmotae]|uniref:hypothetical protein n=1 Tax=Nocardioides marmotae TaxID=2663857 RepID=UPI0012B5CA9C|nr:hypothetical protein [Nocardioides marmotae]MBC9733683.1 hypothetical protein [Nocardioides marmotae]MTB84786.1 hypothetical protein [Nocardioides marmotae]